MEVLVVDRGLRPINRVSWQDAMTDWMNGRAEVIRVHEDRVIRTPSWMFNAEGIVSLGFKDVEETRPDGTSVTKRVEEYRDTLWASPREVGEGLVCISMPAVIKMVDTTFTWFRRGVRFNRKNLLARDEGRCQYCGTALTSREFTLDHVVPRAQGGKTSWDNLVACCLKCNGKKRDQTPEQAKMKLRRKPTRPMYTPGANDSVFEWKVGMPTCWREFLGSVAYWSVELDQK